MRGVPYLKLVAAMLVLTAVTSVIMLIPDWNGEQASTAADDIDRLLDVAIVLSSFVFSIVMVLLVYCDLTLAREAGRRVRRGADPRQHPARDRLDRDPDRDRPLRGRLLLDRARRHRGRGAARCRSRSPPSSSRGASTTPTQGVPSDELHVPVDQQLAVELRALDVLHSFWVPEWRIKRDVVPGAPCSASTTTSWSRPNKEGTFSLICTELCGIGHATMRAWWWWRARRTSTSGSPGSRRSRRSRASRRGPPTVSAGPR